MIALTAFSLAGVLAINTAEQNEAIKEARKEGLMPALVETESYRRYKQKAAKVPKKFRVFK